MDSISLDTTTALVFVEAGRDISPILQQFESLTPRFNLHLALYKGVEWISGKPYYPLNVHKQNPEERRRDFQIRILDFFFEKHTSGFIVLDGNRLDIDFGDTRQFSPLLNLLVQDSRFGFVNFIAASSTVGENKVGTSLVPDLRLFVCFRRVWQGFRSRATEFRFLQHLNITPDNVQDTDFKRMIFDLGDSDDVFYDLTWYCISVHQVTLRIKLGGEIQGGPLLRDLLLPDIRSELIKLGISFPGQLGVSVIAQFEGIHAESGVPLKKDYKVTKMIKKVYRAVKRRLVGEQIPQISDPFFGITVGQNSVIGPCRRLDGVKYIKVGNNCMIGANGWFGAYDYYANSQQTFSPSIEVGDNVLIGDNAIITAVNKVIIEEGVEISHDVYISDHVHSNTPEEGVPLTKRRLVYRGYVKIGAYTGVGLRSVISQGVTLGKYCFVTPNSVVTRSFPDYSMVRGNPAILIKVFSKEKNKWEDPHPDLIKKYNRV